jgi:hypothetical protein
MTTEQMKPMSRDEARAKYIADKHELSRKLREMLDHKKPSTHNSHPSHNSHAPSPPNPPEPGKSAGNQPTETENNPGNTREQSENNPSDPGKTAPEPGKNNTDPGKTNHPSGRSPYEPAHGPRGFLNELPKETQEQILDFLEVMSYENVISILAQPRPHGLGVRVSKGALERFYNRHSLSRLRQEAAAVSAEARAFANDPSISSEDFTGAATRILRSRLLQFTHQVHSFETLEKLSNVLDKCRRTDLAERRAESRKPAEASGSEQR